MTPGALTSLMAHVAATVLPLLAPDVSNVEALSTALDECADTLGEAVGFAVERLLSRMSK